jgi:hypothetical protein
MKAGGIWLLCIGVVVALASLLMPTAIETSVPDLGGSLYGINLPRTGSVYNLGLLQNQLMVFIAGCSVSLAGVILTAAGVMKEALPSAVQSEEPALETLMPSSTAAASPPSNDSGVASLDQPSQQEAAIDKDMYWVVGLAAFFMVIVFIVASISQSKGTSANTGSSTEINTAPALPSNTIDR